MIATPQLIRYIYIYYLTHGFRGVCRRIPRRIYFLFWSQYCRDRDLSLENNDLPKVMEVDPGEIKKSTIPEHHIPTMGDEAIVGTLDGPWDRFRTNFENHIIYRSLEQRFEKQMKWEETDIYHVSSWAVRNGVPKWNDSKSIDEIAKRCEKLDSIYYDIRENGYRSQNHIVSKRQSDQNNESDAPVTIPIREHSMPDEVRVGIGRNGEIIRLGGGRHRVSLAKIVDVDRIPVVVVVRHKRWQDFRDEIKTRDSYEDLSTVAKRNLSHPDILDLRKSVN